MRPGAEAETLGAAFRERIADPGAGVGGVVELRDRCEVRLDRVEAGLVDRRLVHARAVQPAALLFDRAGGGLVGAGVRRFDDAALRMPALLAQLVERAPADTVRGDRGGRDVRKSVV